MSTTSVLTGAQSGLIAAGSNSVDLTKPTTLQVGSLDVIAVSWTINNVGTIDWPDDYVNAMPGLAVPQSGSNSLGLMVRRVWDPTSEPASQTVAWNANSGSSGAWARFAISMAAGVDDAQEAIGGTATTSHAAPSASMSTTAAPVICIFGSDNVTGAIVSYSAPTGMTEIVDTGTTNTASIAVYSQHLTTIGTTGTKTATASSAARFCAYTLTFLSAGVRAKASSTDRFPMQVLAKSAGVLI